MKIKLFFMFCLLPLVVCAAGNTKPEERIMIDGNEQLYSGFPSSYVSPRSVRFVLPEGYDKNLKIYPVVYVLGVTGDKKIAQSPDAVFIFVPPVPGDEKKGRFAKFLTNEIMPYAETNYRISGEPRYRLLAARGDYGAYAADIFALQRKINNLALIDAPVFNVNFKPRGKIYISGAPENILAVNDAVKNAGFVSGKNLMYEFEEGKNFNDLPLNFFFGPENVKNTSKTKEISTK